MDQPTSLSREEIQDDCEIQPALSGLDGLGIRDPLGVGTVSGKLTIQQIGSKTRMFIAFRGWLRERFGRAVMPSDCIKRTTRLREQWTPESRNLAWMRGLP